MFSKSLVVINWRKRMGKARYSFHSAHWSLRLFSTTDYYKSFIQTQSRKHVVARVFVNCVGPLFVSWNINCISANSRTSASIFPIGLRFTFRRQFHIVIHKTWTFLIHIAFDISVTDRILSGSEFLNSLALYKCFLLTCLLTLFR